MQMHDHEVILIPRVEKFLLNMREKHKTLSATLENSVDKILSYLKVYEVGYDTIDKVYELIYWSESHDNIKEVEAEFKDLVDTFWE